jgi:hypothetical protein
METENNEALNNSRNINDEELGAIYDSIVKQK